MAITLAFSQKTAQQALIASWDILRLYGKSYRCDFTCIRDLQVLLRIHDRYSVPKHLRSRGGRRCHFVEPFGNRRVRGRRTCRKYKADNVVRKERNVCFLYWFMVGIDRQIATYRRGQISLARGNCSINRKRRTGFITLGQSQPFDCGTVVLALMRARPTTICRLFQAAQNLRPALAFCRDIVGQKAKFEESHLAGLDHTVSHVCPPVSRYSLSSLSKHDPSPDTPGSRNVSGITASRTVELLPSNSRGA
ncbi:Uncharacterised protein [Mycobacteroides abscessus subsp. abscessus]|nr:Uncharacterised protein [Mycobacteroides abscessus subsp. abscessus]